MEPKVEKDNRLVFDRGKIIESSDPIFNVPHDEIDVETMLMESDSENAVVGLDEVAGKIDNKYNDLKMQNNVNMDKRTEMANIPTMSDNMDKRSNLGICY